MATRRYSGVSSSAAFPSSPSARSARSSSHCATSTGEYFPDRFPSSNSAANSVMPENNCGSSGLTWQNVRGVGESLYGFCRRHRHHRLVPIDLRPIGVACRRGQMSRGHDRQNAAGMRERVFQCFRPHLPPPHVPIGAGVVHHAAVQPIPIRVLLPVPAWGERCVGVPASRLPAPPLPRLPRHVRGSIKSTPVEPQN